MVEVKDKFRKCKSMKLDFDGGRYSSFSVIRHPSYASSDLSSSPSIASMSLLGWDVRGCRRSRRVKVRLVIGWIVGFDLAK